MHDFRAARVVLPLKGTRKDLFVKFSVLKVSNSLQIFPKIVEIESLKL